MFSRKMSSVVLAAVLLSVVGNYAFAQETRTWEKKYSLTPGIPGYGYAVAVDGSGNTFVAGYEIAGPDVDNGVLMKFNSTGALDTTFNPAGALPGVVTYNNSVANGNDYFYGIVLDLSGNVYVTGSTYNGSDYDVLVVKYTSTGALDTSFSTDGVALYDGGNGDDYGYGITLGSNGNVYVTGYADNGSSWDLLVLKYTSVAVLDTTFGTGGVVTYDGGSYDVGSSIAVSGSGNVYVAGYSYNGGNYDVLVLKYDSTGALDTTFSGDGIIIYDSGRHDYGTGIALDNSGSVYVGGYTYNASDSDVLVLKYDSTGTLDTLFSGDGIQTHDNGSDDYGLGIAVDSSGHIYVAGSSLNGSVWKAIVLKYNPSGSLVPAFGNYSVGLSLYDYNTNSGYGSNAIALDSSNNVCITGQGDDHIMAVKLDSFGEVDTVFDDGTTYVEAYAVASDSTGNVYVTGSAYGGSDYDVVVLKYTSVGVLDTTFGTDGAVTYDWGSDDFGRGIAVDSSGNVYVTGNTYNSNGDYDVFILKYTSVGVLDTAFGTGGIVTYDGGVSGDDYGYGIAVDSSGSLYVAGYTYDGINFDALAVKVTSAGALDPTFSGDGVVTYSGGASSNFGYGIAVDDSGNVYVTGNTDNGSDYDVLTLKYTSAGVPDPTFSGDGVVTYGGGLFISDSGLSIAVDSRGSVYVAGQTNGYDVLVLKYDSTGILDTTFSGDGVQIYDGGNSDYGTGIAVGSSGKVYVTGYTDNGDDYDVLILKYTSAGVLDTGFDTDGVATYDSGFGDDYGYGITLGNSFYVAGVWGDGYLKSWVMKFAAPSSGGGGSSSGGSSGGRCYISTAVHGSQDVHAIVLIGLFLGLLALWVHRIARARLSTV